MGQYNQYWKDSDSHKTDLGIKCNSSQIPSKVSVEIDELIKIK